MTAVLHRDAGYWRHLPPERVMELRLFLGAEIIETKVAAPDSQYRLRDCRSCGSDDLAYLRIRSAEGPRWRVRCMRCGAMGTGCEVCHDAQMDWNQITAVTPGRNQL